MAWCFFSFVYPSFWRHFSFVACYTVHVKQSHYRPEQALRVPGGWGSQILRQSAHEDGKVVSPTHWPSLHPREIFLVLISVRGWVDPRVIVETEGLCQWKIPMTPFGIEAATFRFVAQWVQVVKYRKQPENAKYLKCLSSVKTHDQDSCE